MKLETTKQRVTFTVIGVFLMASVMAAFNKYLVYKEFSVEFFRQVLIAFCQKAPLAYIMQYFFVQKIVGKLTARYPSDNMLVSYAIRAGFTVMLFCPIMSLYSNIIAMVQFHWGLAAMIGNWIPKMVVNWIFAFMVQIFLMGPANRWLYSKVMRLSELMSRSKNRLETKLE